jgi:3-hydroxyisobutyrate dehydrogenase-like beta-hydroxyacid dehydrogenase
MKVGVIGLGNMGSKMAARLSQLDYTVLGYDVSRSTLENAIKSGIVKGNLKDSANKDVLHYIISLPTEESITSTIENTEWPKDSVIMDMSTVNVRFSQRNHELLSKKGIGYLDAPVLGMPAQVGKWTIPVGGDRNSFESAKQVLGALGQVVEYMGTSGSGSLIKILNNMISLSAWATISEAVVLADKMNVDLKKMYQIIKGSGSGAVSPMLDRIPRIAESDYKNICSVDVNIKDLEAAQAIAKETKTPSIMISAALNLHLLAHERGFGDLDMDAIVLAYDDFRKKHGGA